MHLFLKYSGALCCAPILFGRIFFQLVMHSTTYIAIFVSLSLYLHTLLDLVTVLYWKRATSSMDTVNKNSSYSPVGPEFVFLCFLGCVICLYIAVCFVLSWTVE